MTVTYLPLGVDNRQYTGTRSLFCFSWKMQET